MQPALGLDVRNSHIWHRVTVDGLTEADIEKSLQSTGLSAMQGQVRKRRAPTAEHKAKKS